MADLLLQIVFDTADRHAVAAAHAAQRAETAADGWMRYILVGRVCWGPESRPVLIASAQTDDVGQGGILLSIDAVLALMSALPGAASGQAA